MLSPLRCLALTLPLCAVVLSGCDGEDADADLQAVAFENGIHEDTDGGAFRVALFSRDGLEPGSNQLFVRVGFHDPGDPDGLGIGVPSARVHLDAIALDGSAQLLDLEGEYTSDGRYLIEDLDLSEGDWSLELRIEAGATIDESVQFVFEIVD